MVVAAAFTTEMYLLSEGTSWQQHALPQAYVALKPLPSIKGCADWRVPGTLNTAHASAVPLCAANTVAVTPAPVLPATVTCCTADCPGIYLVYRNASSQVQCIPNLHRHEVTQVARDHAVLHALTGTPACAVAPAPASRRKVTAKRTNQARLAMRDPAVPAIQQAAASEGSGMANATPTPAQHTGHVACKKRTSSQAASSAQVAPFMKRACHVTPAAALGCLQAGQAPYPCPCGKVECCPAWSAAHAEHVREQLAAALERSIAWEADRVAAAAKAARARTYRQKRAARATTVKQQQYAVVTSAALPTNIHLPASNTSAGYAPPVQPEDSWVANMSLVPDSCSADSALEPQSELNDARWCDGWQDDLLDAWWGLLGTNQLEGLDAGAMQLGGAAEYVVNDGALHSANDQESPSSECASAPFSGEALSAQTPDGMAACDAQLANCFMSLDDSVILSL